MADSACPAADLPIAPPAALASALVALFVIPALAPAAVALAEVDSGIHEDRGRAYGGFDIAVVVDLNVPTAYPGLRRTEPYEFVFLSLPPSRAD